MTTRTIVVIGSSVASGWFAKDNKGWASMLGDALENRGWRLINVAEPGADTRRTIELFPQLVPQYKPDVVIVGLSLMNEGILQSGHAYTSFKSGLLRLIEMIREIGALPVLGGVYPNNYYQAHHYEYLRRMDEEMHTWGVPVLDFLPAVDDGKGRWKEGLYSDALHPNDVGHRRMFERIDLDLFDRLVPPKQQTKARM